MNTNQQASVRLAVKLITFYDNTKKYFLVRGKDRVEKVTW